MIRPGVNIDHVATVRQARRADEPDPVAAAVLAVLGGADGITVHLREDRRHIQDRDVHLLRQVVTHRLNLEMAASDEFQTASYSEAVGPEAVGRELAKLREATASAKALGLHVHLGHGLNYVNVQAVVRIPGVEELNIGHSIVSRAVLVGMERAVREMKQVMQEHSPSPKRPA